MNASGEPGGEAISAAEGLHTFGRNLAVLAARFPELAGILADARSVGETPLRLETSPGGEPSARLASGPWLHSPRAPREEARRLAEAAIDPAADIVVLLGFGLGYLAEACLEQAVGQVIICEAEPALLSAAFESRDLGALLTEERLGFVVGGEAEAILSALEASGATRASILALRAAELASPEWYKAAREAARRWNSKGSANENTLRRFGRLWVRNLAKNMDLVFRAPGVRELERRLEGLPAVVLAAGPSLDEVLPFMHEIAQRAVVICVDTALRSLLLRGPEPDFLVVVDPQYWNWRHVAGLAAPQAIMISESATWPAVFRTSCRRIFLGGSLFPLGRRIETFGGSKGQLGAGGSVATSAWDLGRLLGCAPLWMAGLDLGFPRGATHARASLFEQRALAGGSRLRPAEVEQVAAVCGLQCVDAEAMNGGTVRTDPRMSLYAWWFEARLARSGAPRTLSLCPEGLAIPGMGLGALEELLAAPPRRREIEALLAEAADLPNPGGAEELLARGRAQLLSELEELAAEAEAAVESAGRARSALAAGKEGGDKLRVALDALDRADGALAGFSAKDVVAFLMPPLGELFARRARSLGDNLDQSESIYRNVAESARYHLEVLRRA